MLPKPTGPLLLSSRCVARTGIALLAALALGGCLNDKATDIAACTMRADLFYGYPTYDVNSPRSRFIIGCMATKGYNFDISPADCDSRHPLPIQPNCYTADGWLGWVRDKLRAG